MIIKTYSNANYKYTKNVKRTLYLNIVLLYKVFSSSPRFHVIYKYMSVSLAAVQVSLYRAFANYKIAVIVKEIELHYKYSAYILTINRCYKALSIFIVNWTLYIDY